MTRPAALWRRITLGFGTALAVLTVVLSAPGAAHGLGTPDQRQKYHSGDYSDIYGPNNMYGASSQAQTFTAGLTGRMNRVDLYLREFGPPTAPLTIEIRDTSGGAPGSSLLARASVPPARVSLSGGWVKVRFTGRASVVSGTQYAIVAYTGDTGTHTGYLWYGGGDYSGGADWHSTASPPTSWTEYLPVDSRAFKTYVVTASDLAALLVKATIRVAPGTALSRKAKAIKAAVDAGHTSTACSDINQYLQMVKARIGKGLTMAQAHRLITDAKNLAALLGCS